MCVCPVRHTRSILQLFMQVVHIAHLQWQGVLLHSTNITVTVKGGIFVVKIFHAKLLLHLIFMGQAAWLFFVTLIIHLRQIFMCIIFMGQSTFKN